MASLRDTRLPIPMFIISKVWHHQSRSAFHELVILASLKQPSSTTHVHYHHDALKERQYIVGDTDELRSYFHQHR